MLNYTNHPCPDTAQLRNVPGRADQLRIATTDDIIGKVRIIERDFRKMLAECEVTALHYNTLERPFKPCVAVRTE
jgi:hypothetical protein